MSTQTLERHTKDYKPDAFQDYTEEELRWWVRLLGRRAEMRADPIKKAKDLYDRDNYQAILNEKCGSS